MLSFENYIGNIEFLFFVFFNLKVTIMFFILITFIENDNISKSILSLIYFIDKMDTWIRKYRISLKINGCRLHLSKFKKKVQRVMNK